MATARPGCPDWIEGFDATGTELVISASITLGNLMLYLRSVEGIIRMLCGVHAIIACVEVERLETALPS